MYKQDKTLPKTRRELISLIFKIAFLEAMALSLILPSVTSTGEIAFDGCTASTSVAQCGTGSCNILDAIPFQYSCSATIVFSPAFTNPPKFYSATFTGSNQTVGHPDKAVPATTVVFESDNGTTWRNMPVAHTELYGNQNHESIADLSNIGLANFSVNCITGSSSTNATLRPEYSSDSGATWHELANSHTFLDLTVGSNGICGFTPPAIPFDTGPFGIVSGAKTQLTELRIVGISGKGAGDNPIFNNLEIQFYTDQTLTPIMCIPNGVFVCPASPQGYISGAVTKSSMKVVGLIPFNPLSTYTIFFTWFATE